MGQVYNRPILLTMPGGFFMHGNHKGKIAYALQAISIIPLLLFGVVILLLGNYWFTKTMNAEIENELSGIASNVITMFDLAAPGDYHLEGETALQLFKGDKELTNDYSLIDHIKENTNMDITLYYKDTRILTTIRNNNKERIVGTGAPQKVISEVYQTGESHFYNKVVVNGSSYFAYYSPLYNSDGSVVGMIFVGKPCEHVDTAIQRSIYPLVVADVIAMAVISICLFLYMRNLASSLMQLDNFLADVAVGNLNAKLPHNITERNDELGDIGRLALSMQSSLRSIIEKDTLTQLLNRRSADRKLNQIIQKYQKTQTPFCLAIGDIDFFKKVNDTYGHNCGDVILKNVAYTIREHMRSNGFAARWGGEEFLLVFDHSDLAEATASLEQLLENIRALDNHYEEQTIKVTMTFGIVAGAATDIKELVRQADNKLYEGKDSGRNRIIS